MPKYFPKGGDIMKLPLVPPYYSVIFLDDGGPKRIPMSNRGLNRQDLKMWHERRSLQKARKKLKAEMQVVRNFFRNPSLFLNPNMENHAIVAKRQLEEKIVEFMVMCEQQRDAFQKQEYAREQKLKGSVPKDQADGSEDGDDDDDDGSAVPASQPIFEAPAPSSVTTYAMPKRPLPGPAPFQVHVVPTLYSVIFKPNGAPRRLPDLANGLTGKDLALWYKRKQLYDIRKNLKAEALEAKLMFVKHPINQNHAAAAQREIERKNAEFAMMCNELLDNFQKQEYEREQNFTGSEAQVKNKQHPQNGGSLHPTSESSYPGDENDKKFEETARRFAMEAEQLDYETRSFQEKVKYF